MSVKFSHALLLGAAVYFATEVIISLNRPLIADRWVSESIEIKQNGKRKSVDAVMEMDIFSKGFLTDPQIGRNGYGSRFQFDGEHKDIARVFGFPEKSYSVDNKKERLLNNGFCEIKSFERRAGNWGEALVVTEKECPNFLIGNIVGDQLVYRTEKNGIEFKVVFDRDTRLNPLALAITRWNRHNYLPNAEKFMRERPI